jgi:hypothetical protein
MMGKKLPATPSNMSKPPEISRSISTRNL